jgi:hypothetical protein
MICSWAVLSGPDHAPLYGSRLKPTLSEKIKKKLGFDHEDYTHHVGAAEGFKDKYFRDDITKKISLEKTQKFLEKLNLEYYQTKNRIYQKIALKLLKSRL